jgi:dTDP-4-amino-4,6-dideoxygalactose transaminase
MLALRALAPRAGRPLVVLASFSCPAVACAVDWAGLEPCFADVDPDAWQLDPDDLERLVATHEGRIGAVLGTATLGAPPAPALRERWAAACASAGVPLIVDAAAAAGAEGWTALGGNASLVSLGATKPGGAAEGAVLLRPDVALAARIAGLARFGVHDGAVAGDVGLNGRVSELHAAAMLACLEGLDREIAARRAVVRRLRAELEPAGVTLQAHAAGSAWQVLNVVFPSRARRDRARAAAALAGVETRTLWAPPLHRQAAFAPAAPRPLPVTDDLAARSLSLPVLADLTPDEHQALVAVVAAGLRG